MRSTPVLCWLALTCASALPAVAAPGFIVELRAGPEPAEGRSQRLAAVLHDQAPGLVAGAQLGAGNRWQRVDAPAALSARLRDQLEARLRADPRVVAVVPDVREQRLDVTPSDARFAQQWWLQAVVAGNTGAAGFAKAWERSVGMPVSGPGAVVAVLDSGITSHPELNARVWPGHDFVSDTLYAGDGNGRDNDPSDPGDAISAADRTANPAAFAECPGAATSSWHGTTIAGQVAAVSNNGEGVAAGNWAGSVLPVRVAGKCGAAVGDIIDGLRWAAGLAVAGAPANPNPARIVVLSYGSPDPCDTSSTTPSVADTARLYQATLAELRLAGTLVIVAAGNQRRAAGRPAACPGAFGVVALNREGYKSSYSNFGSAVALATPGGDGNTGATCDAQLADSGIVSTGNLGPVTPGAAGYVAASGTSFAAPSVAAVAALMLAVQPGLTVDQISDGLKRSARPFVRVPLLGTCSLADNRARCGCDTATCGAGMLDADEAVRYAASPAGYAAAVVTAPLLSDARLEACAALLGRPPAPSEPVVPAPGPAPEPAPPAPAGAGGGAVSAPWLLGLALLGAGLRRRRPEQSKRPACRPQWR